MKVELHLIQNFAPSCLNRDDTNTPKDCEFGGHRRARISSQCIKRSVREDFKKGSLSHEDLASRTKWIVDQVASELAQRGKDASKSLAAVQAALKGLGLGIDAKNGATQYLLFIGQKEIVGLADAVFKHWSVLAKSAADTESASSKKKEAKAALSKEVKDDLLAALDGGKAVDLALFGRMLADLPDKNIDAACQVAHAISTNKVLMDMDFYTAVDDLQPEGETGAGMMGITSFNSSCFYRYSLVDTRQLESNLGGDKKLARKALEAFLRASVTAIPTGKQNSMAAQNPPDAIFAVVREKSAPMSLANAFIAPIRPSKEKSLMQASIEAMDDYWSRLTAVYGENGVKSRPICLVGDAELKALKDQQVDSFDKLVTLVLNSVPV